LLEQPDALGDADDGSNVNVDRLRDDIEHLDHDGRCDVRSGRGRGRRRLPERLEQRRGGPPGL
jgi:hypothetical protein